jgi:hypothetical protein
MLAYAAAGCSKNSSDGVTIPDPRDAKMSRDLQLVDDYLEKWDRFAQGENELVPSLRDNKSAFEAALTRLLQARDQRAPARMVFYPVVQVGGSIPAGSELGKASAAILGPDFPVTITEEGVPTYFGGDLFWWWEANRNKYEPYPLFENWIKRDFAQTVVIPMFRSASKKK